MCQRGVSDCVKYNINTNIIKNIVQLAFTISQILNLNVPAWCKLNTMVQLGTGNDWAPHCVLNLWIPTSFLPCTFTGLILNLTFG